MLYPLKIRKPLNLLNGLLSLSSPLRLEPRKVMLYNPTICQLTNLMSVRIVCLLNAVKFLYL